MNLRFIAIIGLAIANGCGREEKPAPKPVAPPVLRFENAVMQPDGRVFSKHTGQPFTGLLHEFWPNGKRKRETTLKDGIAHGPGRGWFADGRDSWTGQNVNGSPDGKFVRWSEDGFFRDEIIFQGGKKVSEKRIQTDKLKTELAAEQSARDKLDATVWKPERVAREYEATFVKLWDDLIAAKHEWKPLEIFDFGTLEHGQLGAARELDWGIAQREFGGGKTILGIDEFRELLLKWRAGKVRLVETEWHQAEFEPGTDGQLPRSLFKMVAHVIDEPKNTRHILRGALRVTWSPKKTAEGQYIPGQLVLESGALLSRTGEAPFVTKKVINVLDDNPSAAPPTTGQSINWGRFDPATLAVIDLDGDQRPEIVSAHANLVYWNRGDFQFEPRALFPQGNGFPNYAVFADFTGDGHLDIFTLNPGGKPEVLPGDGKGGFRPAGLASLVNVPDRIDNASCIAVGDVDGDGDNDAFVTRYKPAYNNGAMPEPFFDANDGYPSWLLLNNGKGIFTDATAASGMGAKRFRRTYSASFVDFDDDGDLDLLVVSDFAGLDLYTNDGKGKFTDVTAQLGEHRFSFGMSHSLADFDGDGHVDIYMVGMGSTTARRLEGMKLRREGFTNIQDARMKMGYGNRLLLGDGKGGFKQAAYNDRVSRSGWSWGCTPWDFDLDGDRDLFIANGHLSGESCEDYCREFWTKDIFHNAKKESPKLNLLFQNSLKELTDGAMSWNGYEHNVLFMNEGEGRYTNVAFLLGVSHESDCRSVVSADLNQDGRPDLLVVEGRKRGEDKIRQGYLQLIENRMETGHHWIGVNLAAAPAAFGAKVTVITENGRQSLPIVAGDSFNAQHPLTAHFGLGKAETATALEVRWSDGKVSRVERPAVDRYHFIER